MLVPHRVEQRRAERRFTGEAVQHRRPGVVCDRVEIGHGHQVAHVRAGTEVLAQVPEVVGPRVQRLGGERRGVRRLGVERGGIGQHAVDRDQHQVGTDTDRGEDLRAPALDGRHGDRGEHAVVEQARRRRARQHQAVGRGRLTVGGGQRQQAEPGGRRRTAAVGQHRADQVEHGVGHLVRDVEVVVVGLRQHRQPHGVVPQEARQVRRIGAEALEQRVRGAGIDHAQPPARQRLQRGRLQPVGRTGGQQHRAACAPHDPPVGQRHRQPRERLPRPAVRRHGVQACVHRSPVGVAQRR